MILVEVGQAIVHVNIALRRNNPLSMNNQCLPSTTHIVVLVEGKVLGAGALAARIVLQKDGTAYGRVDGLAVRIVDDLLVGGVRQMEQYHSDRYEEHSDHKEGGQDSTCGEDGLPGGQALLLESRICQKGE